jgi:predicted DNA-binding protein
MAITMNKELLIRMPAPLYNQVKKMCERRYKSLSAFVRELLIERLEDSLTAKELKEITEGEKEHLKGKGVNWRTVKRG